MFDEIAGFENQYSHHETCTTFGNEHRLKTENIPSEIGGAKAAALTTCRIRGKSVSIRDKVSRTLHP